MATFDLGRANGLIRTVYLPKIIDTVTNSNPLFLMMKDRGELFEGGETITTPIMYGEYVDGEGGSFGDTEDDLPSEAGEDAAATSFGWASYSQPVRITLRDLAKFASTDAGGIRLLRVRNQSAGMKMADRFGDHLYAAVGHDENDILSMNDLFSRTNTYGLIDRSASGNTFWLTQQVNADPASTSTATAITLRKIHDAIEAATQGNIRPDIGLTDETMYNRAWELQMANMRYGDTGLLKYGGFTGVVVDGVPIFKDSHFDNDGSDGANTRHKIRFINLDFQHWLAHGDYNFAIRDLQFLDAASQVLLAQIFWFGQCYNDNPRYNSELINCLGTA